MATHTDGVRTNIDLDAPQEQVKSRKKQSLTDLAGRIRFRKDFDPKELRKLRR